MLENNVFFSTIALITHGVFFRIFRYRLLESVYEFPVKENRQSGA